MWQSQAVDAARALSANPSLAIVMIQTPLPSDIDAVLRFLAGELQVNDLPSEEVKRLRDTLERYVQTIMLYPGASPERVLGVAKGANREVMRAHMRLLMIWLHPDRAGDTWRANYSKRVLDAWRIKSAIPQCIDAPPLNVSSRRVRPKTRELKLSWVPLPIKSSRRQNRPRRFATVLLIVAMIVLFAAISNPVREYAASAFLTNISMK
jgi:hypothetical protein